MCDVMWKKRQVQKSSFEDLAFKDKFLKDKYKAKEDQLSRVFGQDVKSESILAQKNATEQVFRERFGEQIPEGAAMKQMVSEAYTGLKHKSVGGMEKGKRSKEAKEKISLRKHLMGEQQALLDERARRKNIRENMTFASAIERDYKDEYATERGQEALQNWIFSEYSGGEKVVLKHYDALLGGDNQGVHLNLVMKETQNTKISDFLDEDDGAFASNYARKYQQICRLASADVFLELLEKKNGNQSISKEDISASEVRAKIQFFQELKEQYEDRMKMMSSPYYVLLRKADMKEYMGKDGAAKIDAVQDEGLKEYIRQFVKTQSSPLAMGKKKAAASYYKQIRERMREEQEKADEKTAQDAFQKMEEGKECQKHFPMHTTNLADGTPIEEVSEDERKLIELMDDMVSWNLAHLPANNEEFLEKESPDTGGSLLDGMSAYELWDLEKGTIFGDIYQNGRIEGELIEPAVLTEVRTLAEHLMDSRRQMVASVRASMFISNMVSNGFGCDFQNPDFMKTDIAKKLRSYVNDDAPVSYRDLSNAPRAKYLEYLTNIFLKLSEHGYVLSKKYDKRAVDEADGRIEWLRKNQEESLNKGKENPERWDFPTISINGKAFRVFEENQEKSFKQLIGKLFTIEGADGEELMALMEQQETLSKKLVYGRYDLDLDGGMKAMVNRGWQYTFPPELEKIGEKIRGILEKNGQKL